MKKIEDYLPLYIGCKVETPDGIGTMVGLPWRIMDDSRVTVHFGKNMVHTKNSIDGGQNKKRNHGDYAIYAKRYEPLHSEGITEDGFDMPGGIKPLLRPLESMTEEEKEEINWVHTSPEKLRWLKEDNFGMTAKEFLWLFSKSFDLFNLIPENLAIDSTKIKAGEPTNNQ